VARPTLARKIANFEWFTNGELWILPIKVNKIDRQQFLGVTLFQGT
jgi:hypothetical protein